MPPSPSEKSTRTRAAKPSEKKRSLAKTPKRPHKARAPLNRKQKLDRTRVAILQSALEHFGRMGFEGVSLRTIATAAGVNHGMIRHIYGDKDELWRQAVTFLFERTSIELSQNAEVLAGLDDRDRLKAYVRRYVEYCARHPEHARMMIQQSILAGPELTWAAEQFIRVRHSRDLPLLEWLKQAGVLPDVDTIALHFIIVGACQMIYLLAPEVRAVNGRNVFSPDAVKKHADAVVGILFR